MTSSLTHPSDADREFLENVKDAAKEFVEDLEKKGELKGKLEGEVELLSRLLSRRFQRPLSEQEHLALRAIVARSDADTLAETVLSRSPSELESWMAEG